MGRPLSLRVQGEFTDAKQMEDIVVGTYGDKTIFLKNGETKKYETHLSSILSPGTKLSIIMVSNIIFSETTEGSGFEVSDWTETEETITLPPLS